MQRVGDGRDICKMFDLAFFNDSLSSPKTSLARHAEESGFSLTGSAFTGCGTMVVLEISSGEPTGLSNVVISDVNGEALELSVYQGSEIFACDCNGNIYLVAFR